MLLPWPQFSIGAPAQAPRDSNRSFFAMMLDLIMLENSTISLGNKQETKILRLKCGEQ